MQNFAINIYAAQMTAISKLDTLRNFSTSNHFLDQLDFAFVILFTAELVINMYAHWLKPFIDNPWSVFDLLIVALSLIGLAPIGLPLSLLLLLRCCRVLRIFGKFPSVSSIFSALATSLLPMASTFFIIFVLASICKDVVVTLLPFSHSFFEVLLCDIIRNPGIAATLAHARAKSCRACVRVHARKIPPCTQARARARIGLSGLLVVE